MKLIGLYSPYPQMGKNSLVNALTSIEPAAAVLSFADAGRDVVVSFVADFFPGGEKEVWEWLSDERKDNKRIPVLNVTLRHMLQTVLTDWGRRLIHPDTWVLKARAALRRQRNRPLVIFDDVRFENEYHMLVQHDAIMIRVERKDAPRTRQHESNARLEAMDFDYHVSNDGEIEELRAKALLIAQSEGIV